jgi:hypothetical protein
METEPSQNNQENHEHETHVPALVGLIVLTAVISVGVLAWGNSIEPETPNNSTVTSQQTNAPEAVTYKNTAPVDTTDDLPSGLLADNADVVQNRSVELGSRNQRVVIFDTNATPQSLADQYRGWLEDNGYNITSESETDSSVSLAGDSNGNQLILVFSRQGNPDGSRVQLSYVTQTQ